MINKKNSLIIQLLFPLVLIALFYLVFPNGFEVENSIKIALVYIIVNLILKLIILNINYVFNLINLVLL